MTRNGSGTKTARPATPADGIAWVTGASSGIGRFVALELARRGWTVVATARRAQELESLAASVGQGRSGRIVPMAGDVSDRAGIAALVAQAERSYGPVARAFLNAGVSLGARDGAFAPDAILKTVEINVGGTVNCLAPLVDAMVSRGRGQIAITASVSGYGGLPRSHGYGPSKAALINMAESLRLTYAQRGVLVQVVNPGYVRTPLTDRNRFPMPFLVPVEDAARIICDGMEGTGFEIAFPRRLAWLLKAINHLPYAAYFPVIAKVSGR